MTNELELPGRKAEFLVMMNDAQRERTHANGKSKSVNYKPHLNTSFVFRLYFVCTLCSSSNLFIALSDALNLP